jgi:hypothetical protein
MAGQAKPIADGKQNEEVVKTTNSEERTISMSKSELESMIAESIAIAIDKNKIDNQVKNDVSSPKEFTEVKEVKSQNKKCSFRVFQKDGDSDKGIIIDYRFLRKNYDPISKSYDDDIYAITVLYEDGSTKEHEFIWKLLPELTEIEVCEIVSQKDTKVRKEHGDVYIPSKDGQYRLTTIKGNSGDSLQMSDTKVTLYENKIISTFKIKRPNGQEFEVGSKSINL